MGPLATTERGGVQSLPGFRGHRIRPDAWFGCPSGPGAWSSGGGLDQIDQGFRSRSPAPRSYTSSAAARRCFAWEDRRGYHRAGSTSSTIRWLLSPLALRNTIFVRSMSSVLMGKWSCNSRPGSVRWVFSILKLTPSTKD